MNKNYLFYFHGRGDGDCMDHGDGECELLEDDYHSYGDAEGTGRGDGFEYDE